MVKNDEYLITGSNDTALQVWKIYFVDAEKPDDNAELPNLVLEADDDNDMVSFSKNFKTNFLFRKENL